MPGTRTLTIALLALAVSQATAAADQAADPLVAATDQYSRYRRRLIADKLNSPTPRRSGLASV